MGWHEVKKGAIGEGTPKIRVGATRRSPPAKYGQVTVHISATVARAAMLRHDDRVNIEVGTFNDRGWIRLTKGIEHKVVQHGHDGSLRLRFSGRRFGVMKGHKAEVVKHDIKTIKGRTYIILMLPPWAKESHADGP